MGASADLFTLPRWREARLRGKKAKDPWRGRLELSVRHDGDDVDIEEMSVVVKLFGRPRDQIRIGKTLGVRRN